MTETPSPALQPLRPDVILVHSKVVYGRVSNNVTVPILDSPGLSVAAAPRDFPPARRGREDIEARTLLRDQDRLQPH